MTPTLRSTSLALALAILSLPPAWAAFPQTALKAICLQQIHSPTTITNARDGSGRLFVCDQPGKIYIIHNGSLFPTPFLDIASTGNTPPNNGPGPVITVTANYTERGLLGLAFHPGFANPLSPGFRKFYVNYTKNYEAGVDPAPPVADHTPNCTTVISEWTVSSANPDVALAGSERRLLLFTQPQANHNGGEVVFGPDGFLYIGTGDGGSSNDNNVGHTGGSAARPANGLGNSLDRTNYLGKILRIDPIDPDGAGPLTYSIPASNPFFGDPTPGLKKEIYAYGLRNPWRFSFDQRPGGTNRCFCGDVGQGRIEEINLIVSGGNYGWRFKEATEMPTFSSGALSNPMPDPGLGPYIDPIATYAHPNVVTVPPLPQLGLSVTGGFVYRGSAIPALQGKYVFGDYGSTSGASDGRMMGLEETAPLSGVFTLTQAIPFFGTANPIVGQRILCLGEDESGEIYIGMKTNAGVLQLDGGLPAGGIYKIVPVQAFTTVLPATKDNTIFSDTTPVPPITGYPSDALGYLWAGRTGVNHGPYLRRALVQFDVASGVPPEGVIQSAQVEFRITKLGPSALGQTMALHRLTESWGEGTSQNALDVGYGAQATIGDATWAHRFFNSSAWSTLGGTFAGLPSATTSVTGTTLTFTPTAQLLADVQGWRSNPAVNSGWILRGDEFIEEAVCQISSLEKGFSPPALRIGYNGIAGLTRREQWLRTWYGGAHLQFVDDQGDVDGDATKALLEYAWGFSPFALQPITAGMQVTTADAPPDTLCTVIFRRDPRATDLDYFLESGSDLVGWTVITQSLAGGLPTGTHFTFEDTVEGEAPIMLVQADLSVAVPGKQFVRLRVVRRP